jgi:hypothetical protein
MLLAVICVGLILWAVGRTGRAILGVLIFALVVWAAAKSPNPSDSGRPRFDATCTPGIDCSPDVIPLRARPLPPAAAAMYDDSGRPNSHGDILTLPSVMPHHPVHARRARASVAPPKSADWELKLDAEMAKEQARNKALMEEAEAKREAEAKNMASAGASTGWGDSWRPMGR